MFNQKNNLRTCKYNKTMKYFYLTKNNAEEFANILVIEHFKLNPDEYIVKCTEYYLYLEYPTGWTEENKYYYYGFWYVNEGDEFYSSWNKYTDIEFKSKFILQ